MDSGLGRYLLALECSESPAPESCTWDQSLFGLHTTCLWAPFHEVKVWAHRCKNAPATPQNDKQGSSLQNRSPLNILVSVVLRLAERLNGVENG